MCGACYPPPSSSAPSPYGSRLETVVRYEVPRSAARWIELGRRLGTLAHRHGECGVSERAGKVSGQRSQAESRLFGPGAAPPAAVGDGGAARS